MWKYFIITSKCIFAFKFKNLSLYKTILIDYKRYIIMSLKNLKGFVFYVDILGFTALTQDKIQLIEDDFNIWQVSKHFQTLGNQEFAANILILFRKILTNCQNKYPKVNFTQLSDCAFV